MQADGARLVLATASGYAPVELAGEVSPDGSEAGVLFGFDGQARGVVQVEDADLRLVPVLANSSLLYAAGVGDIDGDGHDDLAANSVGGNGELLVFFGPVEGTLYPTDTDVHLIGGSGDTYTEGFGGCFRGGFDVNADGKGELLVSATGEGLEAIGSGIDGAGATYLFSGPLSGVAGPDHARARWPGVHRGGHQSVARVADLTGDGQLDLLLGVAHARVEDEQPETGAIHMVPEAFSGLGL